MYVYININHFDGLLLGKGLLGCLGIHGCFRAVLGFRLMFVG